MTKVLATNLTKGFKKSVKKTLSNTSIRAIAISLLFIISGVGASLLINPAAAAPNSVAKTASPLPAAAPLTQAQANWEFPNGNAFNQDYNPQTQINSSSAQYLGLSWIYPLPVAPSKLSGYSGFFLPDGVGQSIIIVNGTAMATTIFDETIAFNVANGNVLWTFLSPLTLNATAGEGTGPLPLHSHDGNEWFSTATFGSGVHGPTLWLQGQDNRVYAINAITGKQELNFTDFTGLAMVPGNNPQSIYNGIGASNIVIDQQRGILVSGHDAEIDADNGRGFFAGWNLNVNPPKLMWVTPDVPPQPNSGVPLNPNFDTQLIANMSAAYTFYPGKTGTNGYTTAAEVAGGVEMNVNNNLVVDWKNLPPGVENATLYNDWGQSFQTAQCLAIDGGGSTGSTGSGWGGAWLMGSGQSTGMVFVPTNNKDPFTGPCNPGPDLWSASILALNDTSGKIVWGLQTTAHDIWDYDCSWYQGMVNETINGVNTEVVLKTCKNGYMYEINALTGMLIWAWNPPANAVTPGASRCPLCYPPNPLNATWMNADFPTAVTDCNRNVLNITCERGPQTPFLQWPSELAGFEDEQSYNPTTNQIYATSHIVPSYMGYFGLNSSTYFSSTGEGGVPCPNCGTLYNNATVWDVDASTGAIKWHYVVPLQGYRGQEDMTGNMVLLTLSSGDILMLDATKGTVARDYYIGAPMDVGVSIGASVNGQEYILAPIGTCSFEAVATCPGTTPGDVVALTLQNIPTGSAATVTSTATSTVTATSTTTAISTVTSISTSVGANGQTTTMTVTSTVNGGGSGATSTSTTTVTATSGGGVSSTALYGVAAVAVIFIIATGYLAMRGRKPAT
jgi:hypothetical protein